MNRRGFLHWGCCWCALLRASATEAQGPTATGGVGGTDWTLPPRFASPDAASDEGGLWGVMAREEHRLRRSPFLLRDDKLRDYLQGVACRLAEAHCPDVRVYAVRNAIFNANMAPNGMMQIWSGLLLRMDNEAQLAAVVAHEIGHYLQRHSIERLRDAKAKSAAGVFLAPFGLVGLVGQLALVASMYAYTRDQEREADTISIALMGKAGYETAQAAIVWSNLLLEVAARPNADASSASVLFATHPPSDERQNRLRKLGTQSGETGEATFRQQMAPFQLEFFDDELKRGQYEETLALLERKLTNGPRRAELLYFRAEVRRQRGQGFDTELAYADLSEASAMEGAPPQTFRSLGLLLRGRQDKAAAAAALSRYLELAPAAPDAGIIRTYINELQT